MTRKKARTPSATPFVRLFAALTALVGIARSPAAHGATLNAASCSQTDVQAAVGSALDADTVTVPAGNCTWTTPVSFCKGIAIVGAGMDQTNITDNTTAAWVNTPFWISGCTDKFIRISGFTINDMDTIDPNGAIDIRADTVTFRIDHIKFNDLRNRGIWIQGNNTHGVIDHNRFIAASDNRFQGVIVKWNDPESAWMMPMTLGDGNAVYVEDNVFDYSYPNDASVDCEYGARYVFRHNVINGIAVIGNHGYDSVLRSCMRTEVYENAVNNSGASYPWLIQYRGGTGVIFNNTISGNITNPIAVTNYRSCSDGYFPGKQMCDGNSPDDQNTSPIETYHGWPCKDQIGRGPDQSSQPLYEWNNTYNGADTDVHVYNAGGTPGATCYTATHIQENRDFYNDTPRPGYVPYTYPHPLTVAGAEAPTRPKALRIEP